MTFAPSATPLFGLSRYIYGTGRLGEESIAFDERVQIARDAMNAGVWFHTSHTYGDAFRVLRAAYDEDRAHVPPAIFKIGWSSMDEIRDVIRQNLEPLGLQKMAIGQLCLGEPIADELRSGGACYDGFRRLQDEGLVERFVIEAWPWNSDVVLDALRGGHLEGRIDACIFYLNPLQRLVSNELFDLIQERNYPIVAIRTVGGGDVHRQRDVAGATRDYMQPRAVQVAPIFERSGCKDWAEFCVRYAFGIPQVRATVGATSRPENLQELLDATSGNPAPLPAGIQDELLSLQRSWADDYDRHAKPWTM